ncbi:calcium/sodium antiporter [Marinicrinis sediminis]|uniref:Calcium/sodium antiporter n=1 Tax=Marinicrinis sediminis TaxID=1652465 RepID=A0ABW5R8M7_9BACL
MAYIWLSAGFILLIAGANYFVDGSSKIAAFLRVPPILIGLTIVAFGTGSPEAMVSIMAAIEGNAGMSLGNVIGSNVFNTTLVIGVTAIIMAIRVESETIRKEIPFTLLATTALLVMISDRTLQGHDVNVITRGDGILLLLLFSIFMYYIFEAAKNSREANTVEQETGTKASWMKYTLISVVGLAAIIFGGQLVVTNSTTIALELGMTQTMVGLTIVALGTSLPELVTSVAAALKKQNEIAVGNVVGSNIFNLLFVVGVSSMITPMEPEAKIGTDVWMLIFLTLLLLIVSRTQYKVGRIEGILLVIGYAAFMVYVIM